MYEPFADIYARAVTRCGTEQSLQARLSQPLSQNALNSITDDRWLSAFTQKIFQSGMNWQVVRNKWANFEEVFFGFDIEKMLLMHDEMWEQKAKDPRIIRHLGKVMTIRDNALMIAEAQAQHGTFSNYIAHYPNDQIVDLWRHLKQHGSRLGGNTGAYSLRIMGKDTFLLSRDVEGYLRHHGIISTGRDTQSALRASQAAFNHWHQQSQLPYCQISQCIAYSIN